MVKNLPANAKDARDDGLISRSGRSPGGGNGNPLQYSRLENSMDRGAWWATGQSVQLLSRVQLCDSMDHSTPGSSVHHQLPELAQTRPLSLSGHPTISSSVVPFSSCLQSFPASGSFPMSQFFASGGQSIGASASVLPMNIQDYFLEDRLV